MATPSSTPSTSSVTAPNISSTTTDRTPLETSRLLENYETFGWEADPAVSDDANYMDLTLLVTRSSQLRQGSMACLLVQNNQQQQQLTDRIVSVATNCGIYNDKQNSDVHAEVAAVCAAARAGRRVGQCTAYITMPPCKTCCPILYCAGITRVVTRKRTETTDRLLPQLGIDMTVLPDDRSRVDALVAKYKQKQQKTAETEVNDPQDNPGDAIASEKKRQRKV